MRTELLITYVADKKKAHLEDVPLDCSFAKIRRIISKLNNNAPVEDIKLITSGVILRDEQKVGDVMNPDDLLHIYVTGVGRRKETAPSPPPAPGVKQEYARALKRLALASIVLGLLITVLVVVKLSTHDIKVLGMGSLNIKALNIKALNITALPGEQAKKGVALFVGGVIGGFLLYKLSRALIYDFKTVLECVKVFFLGLMPFFDVNQFRAKHGV